MWPVWRTAWIYFAVTEECLTGDPPNPNSEAIAFLRDPTGSKDAENAIFREGTDGNIAFGTDQAVCDRCSSSQPSVGGETSSTSSGEEISVPA